MASGRGRGRTSSGRGRSRDLAPAVNGRSSRNVSYNAVPPPAAMYSPSASADTPSAHNEYGLSGTSTPGRQSSTAPQHSHSPKLTQGQRHVDRAPVLRRPASSSMSAGTGPGRPSSGPPFSRQHDRSPASTGGHALRSPGGYAAQVQRTAGQGAHRVTFTPDREPGIWKVGVPAGARFSTGFLEGLAAWAAAKQKEQTGAAHVRAATATAPSADAPAVAGAAASSGTADAGELAAVTQAFAALQPTEAEQPAEQPAAQPAEAASSTSSALVATDCSTSSAAAEDLRFVPQLSGSQHQASGTLRPGLAPLGETAATADVDDCEGVEPEELQDDASSAPAPQPDTDGAPQPVQISLRLEGMSMNDTEATLLAAWVAANAALVTVRKLWLFDNRLGDEGAAALAPVLASDQLLEVHLSHNMIGAAGAAALVRAVPAPPLREAAAKGQRRQGPGGPGGPGRGLWLRLEWNQIPLEGFHALLREERQRRSLVVDIPQQRPAASRGHQETLVFAGGPAHVCCPWAWCQRQPPAAAPLLLELRQLASERAAAVAAAPNPAALPLMATRPAGTTAAQPAAPAGGGPLLLLPDTSALLAMLGCRVGHSTAPCPLLLQHLQELASAGRFGRALPPAEQAFLLLTDSVAKQLDALKNDASLSQPVRRFLGKGLDACGPAGLDFLTVLGAHEGEGVVVAADAEVAGSRSPWITSNGQRVDAKIVEVGLFFQDELTAAAGGTADGHDSPAPHPMPVLLLSEDRAQLSLARSHGLPAARLSDLSLLPAALNGQQPLSSSLLRRTLAPAATTGLGSKAGRSLQRQFDEAIACLRALHSELTLTQAAASEAACAAANGSMAPVDALAAVVDALQPGRSVPQQLQSHDGLHVIGSSTATAQNASAPSATTADAAAEGAAGSAAEAPGGSWGGLEQGRSMAQAVAAQLELWEIAVERRESASRVLRWTSSAARPDLP